MQSLHSHGLQPLLPRLCITSLTFCRHASLTSAIGRGIRKGANSLNRIGTTRRDQDKERTLDRRSTGAVRPKTGTDDYKPSSFAGRNVRERPNAADRTGDVRRTRDGERRSDNSYVTPERSARPARSSFVDKASPRYSDKGNQFESRDAARSRPRFDAERSERAPRPSTFSRDASRGSRSFESNSRRTAKEEVESDPRSALPPRSRLEIERAEHPPRTQKRWGKERESSTRVSTEAPLGIPYTTAGSEFVYGTFAVKAALEARRRQLHKLYVWKGENSSSDAYDESISKLAKSKRVRVEEVAGSWDRMLMKMSGQRPHNGFVLETSPIPKLPITALQDMAKSSNPVIVAVPPQSEEDKLVNSIFESGGNFATIPRLGKSERYPLLLWLDRVTDTGNLGAIIRSAYFFGIDAIIIPEHGTAPLSPITIKASAGTAEYLPILTVRKELEFVKASKDQGWKFFAAVAPESIRPKRKTSDAPDSVSGALDSSPCVLMVGNEGEGLRGFMQKLADELITIESVRDTSGVVDSLNVSVASAILMARFIAPAKSPVSNPTSHHVQPNDLDTEMEPTSGNPLKRSEDMF